MFERFMVIGENQADTKTSLHVSNWLAKPDELSYESRYEEILYGRWVDGSL